MFDNTITKNPRPNQLMTSHFKTIILTFQTRLEVKQCLFYALIARETQMVNDIFLLLNGCLGCLWWSLEEVLILNLHRNSRASSNLKAKNEYGS